MYTGDFSLAECYERIRALRLQPETTQVLLDTKDIEFQIFILTA
jgi:hypothetical protein